MMCGGTRKLTPPPARRAACILDEAKVLTSGDRQAAYGHPLDHHGKTARLWSAYLGVAVEPAQVSALFILDKLVREQHLPKRDNRVDIAGYANVMDMISGGDHDQD